MYLDIHLNIVQIGSYGSSPLSLTAPRNHYIDEDLPDEDETDASVRAAPASLIPASSPVAKKRITPFLRLGNLWQAGTFAT
jgi:hypothetical protein